MDPRDFEDFRRQLESIPIKSIIRIGVAVVIVVLLAWCAFTSFYTVDADEVGVVQRFGEYIKPPRGHGLHWKLPFGIDRVSLVKVKRVHKIEFGFETAGVTGPRTRYRRADEEMTMLTGDQNIADVEWIVQYKIKDPVQYKFEIKEPEESIRDVSEAAMRLVVGDHSVTEVLTAGRREIALAAKDRLQNILDGYKAGIQITTLELQDVTPPEKVRDSFNEVNRARQEMDTTINQALREYNRETLNAEGEGKKRVREADGFKLKRVNEAQGDVAKYLKLLEEYRSSKAVTRQRLYLESISEIIPQLVHIYVLDEEAGGPVQILDLKEALGAAAGRRTRSGTAKD